MPHRERSDPETHNALRGEIKEQLTSLFEALPFSIPIYLFTQNGKNDGLNRAARETLRSFKNLSKKLELKEFNLSHELAREWKVDRSPTILFDPERYSIRYVGVPYGEEGRTLLGAILIIGFRSGNLTEQSSRVLNKIDSPREIKVFVSPTCPYCPEQALVALKAVVENPQLLSLQIIDIQCNPDLAEQYSAFSVPQTYANEVLIAQGALPEELFMLSLLKMEQQTVFIPDSDAEEVVADVVIVGGGPAGLVAGIYTVRSGLRTAVIERGPLGGQVAITPVVENYPGFTRVPGKTLVDITVSHALEYVQIFQGEEVVEIIPGDPIRLITNRRRFLAKAVILATGASYRRLDVPGEARLTGRGVSYCATCDGPLFKGRRVLVVGGGNSALTEALHLFNIGVSVTIVHRRDRFRAQEHLTRTVVANEIPVLWNSEVKEIRGKERVSEVVLYNNETGKTSTIQTDGVFIAVGYTPTVDLAEKTGIELTADGFIKRDSHHRTNIAGIYSAGDVEGGYKQIITAMGQGAEAAISVFEDLMHPYWKEQKEG